MSQAFWDEFVSYLFVQDVYNSDGLIPLVRLGRDADGGYVVPQSALLASDVMLGYGVRDDISFEESYSNIYAKKSYGFDCSVKYVETKNPLTYFIPECVGDLGHVEQHGVTLSEQVVTSFASHILKFNLEQKKLFIKMDIEGAEYNALPEILSSYSGFITGIALELHFAYDHQSIPAMNILKMLSKDFILVHLHGCNCCYDHFIDSSKVIGAIPKVLELSYINKNIVDSYTISDDQSSPSKQDFPICPQIQEFPFTIIK